MDHIYAVVKAQEAWDAWGKVYHAWLNQEVTYLELEQARANYLAARAEHARHHDMTRPGMEYVINHNFCSGVSRWKLSGGPITYIPPLTTSMDAPPTPRRLVR